MLRNGRPVDDKFRLFHRLYHRCVLEDVAGDRLIGARIAYKNVSVNWSKHSRPWDVIFDYPKQGIARFFVCGLPLELPKELPPPSKKNPNKPPPVKLHSFRPEHVPLDDNFAHCEIWTFREGVKVEKPNLPELVKKEFRQIMSDRSFVILAPEI